MTRLAVLDLRTADWKQLLPVLPLERQRKVLSCKKEADKLRSAGAGYLLQMMLKKAGIPVFEQALTQTEGGKPVLQHHPELHVSLSHSGHWAACALSDQPVGVDVETRTCPPEVARRFFQPRELVADHTKVWVAKEAFSKTLGGGLGMFDRFSVEDDRLVQGCSPLPYGLHWYALEGGLVCLSTVDARPELEIWK